MDISNRNTYYNAVYEAIIVNDDTSSDPEDKGRVQIYIPFIHIMYSDKYEDYMKTTNKEVHDGWNIYPWASTMTQNLTNGNVVYCTNINNENNKYLILGLDAGNVANTEYFNNLFSINSGNNNLSINSGNVNKLLDLAMPIIIKNEVGIDVNDWPDNIPTRKYTAINPYDNGGWSIGLIQWHHTRAFDCLFQIAKENVFNFNLIATSNGGFSCELIKDLQSSIKDNSSAKYRWKYQDNFHPIAGTDVYNFIQSLLGSSTGKEIQRKYASEDTENNIKDLTDNYKINNPAIVIYLADIMNQYGSGIITTKKAATRISTGNVNKMMNELDDFVEWCRKNLGSYSLYSRRRDVTYQYIKQLYVDGKLFITNTENLSDMSGANQGGEYLWPVPTCQNISQIFKGRLHLGVDLTTGKGDSTGEKVIAISNGTITYLQTGYSNAQGSTNMASYGNMLVLNHNNGTSSIYAHLNQIFVKNGDTVKAGQVIATVGNTGNSYGAHLHFEFRTGVSQGQGYGGNYVNPIPYIRKA